MIDIQLSPKLKIVSDAQNFALAKPVILRGEERWTPFEWYAELDHLIEELFKKDLRAKDVKNVTELALALEKVGKRYSGVILELNEALKV